MPIKSVRHDNRDELLTSILFAIDLHICLDVFLLMNETVNVIFIVLLSEKV